MKWQRFEMLPPIFYNGAEILKGPFAPRGHPIDPKILWPVGLGNISVCAKFNQNQISVAAAVSIREFFLI